MSIDSRFRPAEGSRNEAYINARHVPIIDDRQRCVYACTEELHVEIERATRRDRTRRQRRTATSPPSSACRASREAPTRRRAGPARDGPRQQARLPLPPPDPRAATQKLRRVGEGEFEATKAVLRAGHAGSAASGPASRHVLIGEPLAIVGAEHERLSKMKALAIFSSDALSSSAYATEEILLVLILAGTAATDAARYRSRWRSPCSPRSSSPPTARRSAPIPTAAAPTSSPARTSASVAGLVAGSALLVDYIMTVAVSTAAGVAAITSAVPELHADTRRDGAGLRGC